MKISDLNWAARVLQLQFNDEHAGEPIVTLSAKGEVTINPKYSATEAAQAMWAELTKIPIAIVAENDALKAEIAQLRAALSDQHKDAAQAMMESR